MKQRLVLLFSAEDDLSLEGLKCRGRKSKEQKTKWFS